MSSSENLDDFRIPLEEIKWATEKFIHANRCSYSGFEEVYRFEYSDIWLAFKRYTQRTYFTEELVDYLEVRKKFLTEVRIVSKLKHENIFGFRGYCDEAKEMIIVYEWHDSDVLARLLQFPHKRSLLTWERRLKICFDVAGVLNYLHSGLGEHGTVIQNCVSAENIFLDKDMNVKIFDFEMSELIPANQQRRQVYKMTKTYANDYMDPIYRKTNILRVESDIYSSGVLLFQMLTKKMDICEEPIVQRCYKYGLDQFIDPVISSQIGSRHFHMIRDLAYKCTSYNIKDRPSMDTIVKTIQEALDIHNQGLVTTTLTKGNEEYQKPINLLFPLEELQFSTINLGKYSLSNGLDVIDVQLSESWKKIKVAIFVYNRQNRNKFLDHLYIVSQFHHENILPFIGYYYGQDHNQLLVFIGYYSLLEILQTPKRLHRITWEQRLKICLGAARGLRCLHSGLWKGSRVVHRGFRSEIIYLDENMEARIGEFESVISISRNQPQVYDAIKPTRGNKDYMDPIYEESKAVNVEVDVYSFGVVMFEILSGLTACPRKSYDDKDYDDVVEADVVGGGADNDLGEKDNLMQRVYRYYDDELEKLIDPNIRDQIDVRSLRTYTETAYGCLSFNIRERPSINRIIKRIEEVLYFQKNKITSSSITSQSLHNEKLEDLIIPLIEINLATRNFSKTSEIGKGGFGVVYKGRLSEHWKNHEVAIKRLDKTGHQGKKEFLNELKLIVKFHHQNIIPFVGYCDEGEEMILVYEYANNGSLDYHLEDKNRRRCLTWVKRLKICLGACQRT